MLPKTVLVGGAIVGLVIIYSMGVDRPNSESTTPTSSTARCRVAVTADILNVRSAPDPNADIVGKFKVGAESDADPVVQNGFRKLGDARWASSEFLKPLEGRNCG